MSLHGVCVVICVPSNTTVTGSSCKCVTSASTNECAADKFCWTDNTCKDAMKLGIGECPLSQPPPSPHPRFAPSSLRVPSYICV